MKKLICEVMLFIGACVYLGFAIGQLSYQPKVVEIEIPRTEYITVTRDVPSEPVIIEVPVDRYITVTKEKPVEVIVYRNIFPRSWESKAEFVAWYEEQEFKVIWNIDPDKEDCDDYAKHLQIEALKQGYPVSQALALSGKYYGKKVTDHTRGHAGNLVLINNTYYWVEPNPEEFDMVRICSRD